MASVAKKTAKIALMGHNGAGHATSHSGFVQDDSIGFAMLVNFLQQYVSVDLTVKKIRFEGNGMELTLCGGGKGSAFARRGITNYEKEILKQAVGKSSFSPHDLSARLFGRVYGQGVSETAVALNLAYSRAVLQTLKKAFPDSLHAADNTPSSAGEFLAGKISAEGIPTAFMLTVNATDGGLSPNEDSEGNIPIGNKGILMKKLGMDCIPTIILESKAYVPALKDQVRETSFWVRWNKDHDNSVVGKSLIASLQKLSLPFLFSDTAYKRGDTSLADECARLGDLLAELGARYKNSRTSAERIEIASVLSKLISEDFGGSIFMSNKIFEITAGGGLLPGLCAVLSVLVPEKEMTETNQINYSVKELQHASLIISQTIKNIHENYADALKEISRKKTDCSPEDFLLWASR